MIPGGQPPGAKTSKEYSLLRPGGVDFILAGKGRQ